MALVPWESTMAKYDVNRMGDSTRVNKVDDQHNQCEEDSQDIFGIPDNTPITAYVFGRNPQNPGAKPIQPDGSIRGVPVLASNGPQAAPENAVGFKWDDGSTAKLLVFVNSELQIYKDSDYPNGAWTRVASVETPGTGKLVNLTDYVGPEDLSLEVGKLLKVVPDGGGGFGFGLADPIGGAGVTTFIELTDGPLAYGNPGDMLVTNNFATGVVWAPPPVVAAPLILFARAQTVDGWGETNNWLPIWRWELLDPEGSGYVETNEATYLGQDVPNARVNAFFINLPPGPYECSMWYTTEEGIETTQGVRQWRMQGSSCFGPAIAGVSHRATVGFDEDGIPRAIDGAKYLGTRMFLVGVTTTDLKIEVLQDSGGRLGTSDEVTFYCVIRRIQ